jgi:NADPH-dependent ferric siderophore reductase
VQRLEETREEREKAILISRSNKTKQQINNNKHGSLLWIDRSSATATAAAATATAAEPTKETNESQGIVIAALEPEKKKCLNFICCSFHTRPAL